MDNFHYVGIDVAKDKFDVALIKNNSFLNSSFNNNQKGYVAFLDWLNLNTSSPWVCMEATGHYSEAIAEFLSFSSIQVSVVNPVQIKNFARATLTRNKNDILDARIIASYCKKMLPPLFVPRDESQKELKDLTNLLDILKAQHTQLTNQLYSAQTASAQAAIYKLLKDLQAKIDELEKQIAAVTKQNRQLAQSLSLITSIKGIGFLTACKILACVPDINRFATAKQFAAFIGISPKQHQSGLFAGRTTISRLGNARLRRALYMPALTAMRFNQPIKAFALRLKERGKKPKAIICAVMRKLAHMIFGVLKHKTPFDVKFHLSGLVS